MRNKILVIFDYFLDNFIREIGQNSANFIPFPYYALSFILFIVIAKGVIRSLKEKPKTGPEALIGLDAKVIKELSSLGQVEIRGEIW